MRTITIISGVLMASAVWAAAAEMPKFKTQEIDKTLKIGYGTILADINGDGKSDIVVADQARVIWFENPSWQLHTILTGKTKPDNVCLDAYDIDGDGKLDLALGAGWKPSDTKNPGTLQWLRRPKTGEGEWEMFEIANEEPTIHRIRWADLDGDGKKELISVPLQGKGATPQNNFGDGKVRVFAYRPGVDPTQIAWGKDLLCDQFPVMHNFQAIDFDGDGKLEVLAVSYEGLHVLKKGADEKWSAKKINAGDQTNPAKSRGASEIKLGKLKSGTRFIGTIEPWHGNQVVVYTNEKGSDQWSRRVLDSQLLWGHAIWCADLDGDGDEELIAGVRDPMPAGKAKSGVRIYKATDSLGTAWEREEVDPGGVAVEDLTAGDLNGDGKIDLVAVGRATGNVRIYWNETASK
jgi:hypothetical protein